MPEHDTEYARSSPMMLCVLVLEQAVVEAENAVQDPQRWFFAIPEMHRALGCALVAALAGPAQIGAYDPKLQKEWIAYLDNLDSPAPAGDRVQSVRTMLARVQDVSEPEMQGRPVGLTEAQRGDLARLGELRDDMEHAKPGGWSLMTTGLPRILASTAEVIGQLLQEPRCRTEFEECDERRAERAINQLRALPDLARSRETS